MSSPAEPLLWEGVRRQQHRRDILLSQPPAQRRQGLEAAMVELARRLGRCHPGYARRYAGSELSLATVPVLEKADLAEPEFAAAAGVSQTGAASFLSQPFELGSRYDERRVLFTSSGSTGQRLLVPYDLIDLGSSLAAFRARAIEADQPGARRMLYVGLLDRHNGGNAWMHHLNSLMEVRLAHLFDPVGELSALVEDFRPDVILTRPHLLHALGTLAAAEGRRLPRTHLLSVGDPLTESLAAEIERLWASRPHNSFSTVETGPLGYQDDPAVPALTTYDDLSLIELVDEAGRLVREPGVAGRIVVTTLYRVGFPLVRYAVGDVATWWDERLTRLSFPTGRSGLRLTLEPAGAAPVVLEDARLAWPRPPGVGSYQLRQTGPARLLVRWTPTAGADVAAVGERLRAALAGMLAGAGVPAGVRLDAEPVATIQPDPNSGKVKRMIPLPAHHAFADRGNLGDCPPAPPLPQEAEEMDTIVTSNRAGDRTSERPVLPSGLDAIGHTPLVPLRRLSVPGGARVLVKLEYFNPTGSYKDRMALAMVEEAERRGQISPNRTTIVEYTGGSTGSSLSFVCAVKGYGLRIVSSDAFSEEKLRTMTSLGAELIIVPSDGGRITPDLMPRIIDRTRELATGVDTYWTDQFNNPDNPVGQRTMGREILEQTDGQVDAFVVSVGTAGCAMGVAYELKKHDGGTLIGVVEPSTSAVISGGRPGSHRVEGIALGFVPPLLDPDLYDEVLVVDEDEARAMTRRLATEEGIFAGTSSGMNVVAALRVAARLGPGATVVTAAVDSGLKYISTDLYPRG